MTYKRFAMKFYFSTLSDMSRFFFFVFFYRFIFFPLPSATNKVTGLTRSYWIYLTTITTDRAFSDRLDFLYAAAGNTRNKLGDMGVVGWSLYICNKFLKGNLSLKGIYRKFSAKMFSN